MKIFPSSDALAVALADAVTTALQARITSDGAAALAVSGGTTPLRFFKQLASRDVNWAAVTVTLVDDRWVPAGSPRSNEALVRQHLLQGKAAVARFLPLVNGAATPEAGRDAIDRAIAGLSLPFAAVVLGMGTDGHTASFFPGGDRLAEALAPVHGALVETMRAEAAIEPRITLTLPVLLAADYVALHIEGEAKRRVLENLSDTMPVAAVLAHQPVPDIFWSP
ncbi:MAG: 6-phosphogluconolactonase [Acidocella sp. 20-57-95]|nr:MAG: 6-phosphogluconolactonase [Acidocella sp. 20-57-95]OYV59599.1 MAG: 6-phosphogluconolactonase [Acidocella sp. 21-58-7]HQT63120.1 6-phosphogluconolactonase [Acidocella sp.]HQU04867.1 6-phosphogluconolactonase [Acidocella sp.]